MSARKSDRSDPRRSAAAFVLSLLAAVATAWPSAALRAEPLDSTSMPASASDVESVLGKVKAEDRTASDRLSELSIDAARTHALLVARGRAYVRMARAGLLPIGGGIDALVDHASRLERLRLALAHDLAHERAIAEERVSLAQRRESLGDRLSVLESEHAALARSHAVILAAQDREAAFRHAFTGGAVDHTAVYGSGVGPAEPGVRAFGFASLRGRLPFPIEGRAEIRPIRLPGADGPGLAMGTSPGTVVRTVSAGRIAFADVYAEYGRAVIVDHGGGYYTVSGNLAEIDVAVGDEVPTGARLGVVGSDAQGTVLYFEIRKGAQTLAPAPWFGI